MVGFLLNLPYTVIGLIVGLLSFPKKIDTSTKHLAFIIRVKNLWWTVGYMKGARAVAIGQVVLLGPKTELKDLEHELVHVAQHQRFPFVFPILYYFELWRSGYRNNKYEGEAYRLAGNIYRGK